MRMPTAFPSPSRRSALRCANAFEQIVQLRIVERARHDGHRCELQCVRERLLFPKAEMPCAEKNALSLRKGKPNPLFTFPLDERHLPLARQ